MARLLVTDDDPIQLKLRKMVLQAAGHDVAVAGDCPQTLRALEGQAADVLIMDLRLPNERGDPDARCGMALIRQIHDRGCRTKVIVLSGWPEELYGSPEESMVGRVLVKPVPPAELLGAIKELTDG